MKKEDLIKISDYIWEIPKSYRSDMNVPARIFVSEEMLDELFKDKSLWQLVNVASLPGIYKYALAMPDVHEGYGFCIGAVAAFDYENGIISPGGIGFDINCVHPKTRINLDHGAYLEIKDLLDNKNIPVITYDQKEGKQIPTDMVLFLKREAKKILKIKTKFGYQLLLTEDHPVFTSNFEKKLAKDLKPGDEVFIYPFKGVKYEKPERILIMDEKRYKRFVRRIKLTESRVTINRHINYLKRTGLLPLYLDSPAMPYIIKLLGYSIGKGIIWFGKYKKLPGFYAAYQFVDEIENLQEIAEDLKKIKIDFSIKKTIRRKREFYSLSLKSNPFSILLLALGAPFNNKTKFDYKLPKWLLKAPKFYQRLFLASLFGSQGALKMREHETSGYAFAFGLNVKVDKIHKTLTFLNDLRKMMEKNFKIKTSKPAIKIISNVKEKSAHLIFYLSSKPKNLIKFFETINFEYSFEKRTKALILSAYLRHKLKVIKHRKEIVKKIREYKKRGYSLNMIKEILLDEENYINEALFEKYYFIKKKPARVPAYFIKPAAFKERYFFKNLICDRIEEIKAYKYNGEVFDITVKNDSHNFFANNILVSNCGVRLAVTNLSYNDVKDKIPKLTEEIFKNVPSGVGRGGFWKLNKDEMRKVLENGAKYIVELGYGEKEDLEATESYGCIEGADADTVSQTAKKRGEDQLGTLGAGNHFLEIQKVAEVFDDAEYADFTQTMQNNINADYADFTQNDAEYADFTQTMQNNINADYADFTQNKQNNSAKSAPSSAKSASVAERLGLEKDKICVLIHCGSRGLGHQVASDYIREFIRYCDNKNIKLVDKELAYAPIDSDLGRRYFSAMKCASNFAWANRQLILNQVRKAFKKIFGDNVKLTQIYDVAHNIAKIEEYAEEADLTQTVQNSRYADYADLTQTMQKEFLYGDITFNIRKAIFEVRKKLGLGHKENVYKNSLIIEFKKLGLNFEVDKAIEVKYENKIVGIYKPDFIVEKKIVVEIKSMPQLTKEHEKQLWYYLKSTGYKLGILVNFGGKDLEIKRIACSASSALSQYCLRKLIVHRKGATRAFWKGHKDLPEKYRDIGQPVIIPGSMGTESYLLIGQELAKDLSFGSAPHGAGRTMSRAEAIRKFSGSELKKELEKRGIIVAAGSIKGLSEEAPLAYKDVKNVVEIVHNIGIAKKIVKLIPLGVVKG
jgi:tRNA-splicing ligase RtcB